MCHHIRHTDARTRQARDTEGEPSRRRTDRRTIDDRDAPADPDDDVDEDPIAVDDGGTATEGEDPGGIEAEPEPVGFA